MPFYEYACQSCDHELEALQKISEEPLVFCPECGTDSLRKKISAPKFVLKGSGWYETDFKNGDKKKDSAKDSEKDKKTKDLDTKSDSGGTTESKSQKKGEAKSDNSSSSKPASDAKKTDSSGTSASA